MAAYERRSFAGAAVATTVVGSVGSGDTSINIASATGWPDGSGGNFFVVIDKGTASEEKIEIATRSGTTLTVAGSGRGSDGTSAVSHAASSAIALCATARDFDEANAHIAGTGLDHHTQYLNTTRHDVTARHAFGAALGTPAAAADVGTAASAGSGSVPARSDHVHKLSAAGAVAALSGATLTGALDFNSQEIQNPTVVGAKDKVYTANVSGAVTINSTNGSLQLLTLTGNVTSITPSNFEQGERITVLWIQDGTGSRTTTWPAWVWVGGAAVATANLKTTANAVNILEIVRVRNASAASDYAAFLGGDLKA